MTFPDSYKIWMWVLLGGLGTSSSIMFSFYMYNWIRSGIKNLRSSPYSNHTMLGIMFLFASGLMCCGIAGPPGYALSDNPALVSKEWILRASVLSNVLGVIGWIFMLIGQKKTAIANKTVEDLF